MAAANSSRRGPLPGFRLSLGLTLFYLGLIVLVPLSALVLKAASIGVRGFWETATSPRVVASYGLSIKTALAAALINSIFGLVVAWVLVRYSFPGKKALDALVDLPLALPTAVAGIVLTTLYAPEGVLGKVLAPFGIKVAFAPAGIVVALIFVGIPLVVRSVQPVLANLEADVEEAAASLGANRWQTFSRVIAPALLPGWLTGLSLAFARGLGEYGSVVFIAGNLPMKTEITPLLIMCKLDQYDYQGATVIAVVLLSAATVFLLVINGLERLSSRRGSAA